MISEQLTLGMFFNNQEGDIMRVLQESTAGIKTPCSYEDGSPAKLSFIGTKVMSGESVVGWISPLHDKILRSCDSLYHRGLMKFNLLDLVVELECLFPEDKYLETTISARLRELCQWKLVQRESEKSRSGIYIFHGGVL
jgi:hypothetical protein